MGAGAQVSEGGAGGGAADQGDGAAEVCAVDHELHRPRRARPAARRVDGRGEGDVCPKVEVGSDETNEKVDVSLRIVLFPAPPFSDSRSGWRRATRRPARRRRRGR